MKPIKALLHYAIENNLITSLDYDYAFNRLSSLIKMDERYEPYNANYQTKESVDTLLKPLLDHALSEQLIERDSTQMRDLFESTIMDVLTPLPSRLQQEFEQMYQANPQEATTQFYQRNKVSNYIKTARIAKNDFFKVNSPYGPIEITINLSKPEKDPKAIMQAQTQKIKYPKCLLCKENIGYYGRADHPGRTNHRAIRLTLNEDPFYLQYSPYVYYNEHAIVFHRDHIPMNVSKKTFSRLFDFVDKFPHYFLGSNAGLPIVGGSILSHEHYQGGNAQFPIDQAEVFHSETVDGIMVELLKWPLSVIRLKAKTRRLLIDKAEHLRQYFKTYNNDSLGIVSHTNDTPHNAITPILRKDNDEYVLSLALRNNRTNEAYPDGIFHPHPERHHIKKENIGLIEVMGLAILPGRLENDLSEIASFIKEERNDLDGLEIYAPWVNQLVIENKDNVLSTLKQEVGKVFIKGLEDCGLFKQTIQGKDAFKAFIKGWIQCESQK